MWETQSPGSWGRDEHWGGVGRADIFPLGFMTSAPTTVTPGGTGSVALPYVLASAVQRPSSHEFEQSPLI